MRERRTKENREERTNNNNIMRSKVVQKKVENYMSYIFYMSDYQSHLLSKYFCPIKSNLQRRIIHSIIADRLLVTMSNTGSVRLINSIFVWDISDFTNKCKAVEEYVESPCFAAGDLPLNKIKWCLRLYPFGRNTENKDFLSLYLYANFCGNVHEIEISYKFYVWNSNEINTKPFITKKFMIRYPWSEMTNLLERNGDELKNHLSLSEHSILSIACCIKSTHNGRDLQPPMELNQGYLNTFFLSEKLSDVTIKIDNKKLKAHQIILATKSEVFLAMFNHDMKESNERIVKVTDVSYNVMKEVLRYIYCEEVENLDLLSRDLLAAADKYGIFSLKKICEEALERNVNVSNACEVLRVSHLHQCIKLKDKTMDFIIDNLMELIGTDEFTKLIKNEDLNRDIYHKIALKKVT